MNALPLPSDEAYQHAVYRAILQALSRPGSIRQLPPSAAGSPLSDVLDCLFDNEVRFCLADADAALTDAIRHRTGSICCAVETTDFLIAPDGCSYGLVARLPRGTPDYPDRGATVIYQVDSFADGGMAPLLTGPGIKDRAQPSIQGLAVAELPTLQLINRDFPLGIDALFVSRGGEILGLPRSTRIGI